MAKAVQFGAGNIGRGFTGQLFSEAGLEVVFVDVASDLVDLLNQRRGYRIRVASEQPYVVDITGVRAVNGRDIASVAAEIVDADLLCTAVGVKALPHIAPALAAGIKARADRRIEKSVNIIICENLQNMSGYLRGEVRKALAMQYHAYLDERVGFVESVVGRMVPVMTEEQKREDPLLVVVEPYKHLPIAKDMIKGIFPDIPGIEPAENFQSFVDRKLYTHNCGHAAAAYFGFLKGYEFVYESMTDPQIQSAVRAVMRETGEALIKKHGFSESDHQEHIEDLLRRFGNVALGDQVARVGGDPARKLGPDDRLVGAARLALEYGVYPQNVCKAIAAALYFDPPGDPTASRVQSILKSSGVRGVLFEIGGLPAESIITREVERQYELVPKEFQRVSS